VTRRTRRSFARAIPSSSPASSVVGDLFDVWFKADTRNVRLLQQYIGTGEEAAPSTWRHWLFVIAVIGGTTLVLVLLVLGVIAFIHWVVALIRGEPTSI
jgi:hypothetical protein